MELCTRIRILLTEFKPVDSPLGRNQLGGRNWEGFSPDPYLTGVAMSETIRGMQSVGVQACAKHFIGNEQETQMTYSILPRNTHRRGVIKYR